MKNTIISVSLLMLTVVNAIAQDIDTNKLLLNSKMLLIPFLNAYEDEDYFYDYIKYKPLLVFVPSKGFEGTYVFYKIKAQDTVVTKKKISSELTLLRPFFQSVNYDFIFGYNTRTNKIYRLKGFNGNDFLDMYLEILATFSILHDRQINRREFPKEFSIEGIDLKCLWKDSEDKIKRDIRPCLKQVKPINSFISK